MFQLPDPFLKGHLWLFFSLCPEKIFRISLIFGSLHLQGPSYLVSSFSLGILVGGWVSRPDGLYDIRARLLLFEFHQDSWKSSFLLGDTGMRLLGHVIYKVPRTLGLKEPACKDIN